jgi:hypothetical protein
MSLYCKLCFDAKNPGYNTHNVRDTEKNITCPYLLKIKCRNCGLTGHTASYCSGSKKNYIHDNTVKKNINIIVPQPKPLLNSKDVAENFNNHELPPISSIKWGFGFDTDKTSLCLWADETEHEQQFRRPKKTAGMSWARITAAT